MKKLVILLVVLALVTCVAGRSYAEFKRFNVYTERSARDNHYIPSGWMGDWGDIKLDTGWKDNPHSGVNCIKITYTADQKQGAGWAGMYWQNPPNNWGAEPGGFDLTGATRLVLWARGAKGGEKITEFKVGGITGDFADSGSASIGSVILPPEWNQYSIDLGKMNLSHISGGFCWAASAQDNPDGFTIYLDYIYYEKAQ